MNTELALGKRLKIRSMIHVAAEHLPFFWPMRTFIHHNPLHGLEHLPFEQAVKLGAKLFHAKGALPRCDYQRYMQQGKINVNDLRQSVTRFIDTVEPPEGIDLHGWLMQLLLAEKQSCCQFMNQPLNLADAKSVYAVLHHQQPGGEAPDIDLLANALSQQLLGDKPVYETIDSLYGSNLGNELDDLVVKSCLDFFDEGQSVWGMPGREKGFFRAWSKLAQRNVRFLLRGLHIGKILEVDETPEGIIAFVMETLEIPEEQWVGCFTRELAHLHGWAGFIRWRSSAKHYYWTQRYPADLVDFMAVRLSLALAILHENHVPEQLRSSSAIQNTIQQQTVEVYLRHELHTRNVLPALAQTVDSVIAAGDSARIKNTFDDYILLKKQHKSEQHADILQGIAAAVGQSEALLKLSDTGLDALMRCLTEFEQQEGMLWLQALESNAINRVKDRLNTGSPANADKRPFAQALFCIDTRSEPIRRHLESVGDYQTFGIAGFFGVPVSFMQMGKGSETHLCPVLLTPKNLVTEISISSHYSEAALSALEHAMHELKESVLTPFVTVEAIGLLFGFDMVGKTLAPKHYTRWRKRLQPKRSNTSLLLDKLDRAQADSIVRAVQRAMIVAAIEQQFGLELGEVTDDMIRELRESALGNQSGRTRLADKMNLNEAQEREFIESLQQDYRINSAFAQMQMERLGRIGFTLEEQVHFVGQAMRSIGLTKNFSRFVMLIGHGSSSENNPFESALDCGACGGNHGLVNARVLAQMANKPDVRRRLLKEGIHIPDDTWFVAAFHNTTTDSIRLHSLEFLPPSLIVYLDRLIGGVNAASKLCAQERIPTLEYEPQDNISATAAYARAQRNSMDWSQVRPEWGLSRNAYFFIGRRNLTRHLKLDGRAFLHSYDYQIDSKQRLLETILTGPLVVAQWINMEHYFSTVDNESFGSGSKVYHNVAGRFGVMSGNISDLRTGLPSQTVMKDGKPYHEPMRLITVIESPLEHARRAINAVATVKNLIVNGWIRLLVIDPETATLNLYKDGEWQSQSLPETHHETHSEESS